MLMLMLRFDDAESDTWYMVHGTWYMVHGTWYMVAQRMNGTRYENETKRNETKRNENHETRITKRNELFISFIIRMIPGTKCIHEVHVCICICICICMLLALVSYAGTSAVRR
jgi:hypothetical protein